jgi:hypothetical protein
LLLAARRQPSPLSPSRAPWAFVEADQFDRPEVPQRPGAANGNRECRRADVVRSVEDPHVVVVTEAPVERFEFATQNLGNFLTAVVRSPGLSIIFDHASAV